MNQEALMQIAQFMFYLGFGLSAVASIAMFVWTLIWLNRWTYWAICELLKKWYGMGLILQALKHIRNNRFPGENQDAQ
jgi:hypothetical protein